MRVRKFLCIVFACFMLVNCLGISAGAANLVRKSERGDAMCRVPAFH